MYLQIFLCLLAILCTIYGIIISRIGSVTRFYRSWYGIAVIAIATAIILHTGIYHILPVMLQRMITIAVFAGLIFFSCVEVRICLSYLLPEIRNLDYIIVLGSHVFSDGPCVVLQGRLRRAITYLNENPRTICIVSGGQGYDEPISEAFIMKRYLLDHGIAADRIIMEDKSTTTMENLEFSRPMIPQGASIGIITSNFHLFRALQMARKKNIHPVYGIPAASSLLYLPNNMFREFFALLLFWFRSV